MNALVRTLAIFVALVLPVCSFAQGEKPLAQVQREEALRKATAVFEQMDSSLNRVIEARKSACRMAVGYPPFCDCVMRDLPVAWSFDDYIAITTRPKEQNGYDKLTADYKLAYDKVAPIRDKCVREINAKK